MKIFWSWQSDHPGEISHYFVRDALRDAIKELKRPPEIEEPSEAERRAQLELDHDTKGLAGMPDIAASVFDRLSRQ